MFELFLNMGSPDIYLANPLLLAMAALGAGSVIGNVISQKSANDTNKQLAELQHQWNREDWNMVNAYNTPVNQMNRLFKAGINPNFGGVVDSGNASAMNVTQPAHVDPLDFSGFNDVASNVINSQVADANIKKIEAETEGIEISNRIARAFGLPTAKAGLDLILANVSKFRAEKEYQDILNSKAGIMFEAQITKLLEEGQQIRIDNLIKTDAYDDIVASYGADNAYKFAQARLADITADYVPYNSESQRISSNAAFKSAQAAEKQAAVAQQNAANNFALIQSMINLNDQSARETLSKSMLNELDYLVKTNDMSVWYTPAKDAYDTQIEYFKAQAERLPKMTENEAKQLAQDYEKWLNTPVPVSQDSWKAGNFGVSKTTYKTPKEYNNPKKTPYKTGQFD